MVHRERYSSGTEWEAQAGYSRALRVGQHVYVSGTTATNERGGIVGVGDPAAQTRQILRNIETALSQFGGHLGNVVRTRMFVLDFDHWEEISRVHGEMLGHARPAATMVAVAGLVHPDMLVEIEADAVLDNVEFG